MPVNTVELNKLAKNCIEGEPPRCVGACPFNMDVRAFCLAVAEGNMVEARRTYEDKVLLPYIMAEICDAHCKKGCLRRDLGGSIETHILEKHIMKTVPVPEPLGGPPAIPKRQRLAVIGAGLSGLFAVAALVSKKYSVTVFEAAKEPGGRLREREDLAGAIKLDMEPLGDAQFLYGIEVGMEVSLEDIAKEFDAVIICWGAKKGLEGLGEPDPDTLQTKIKNIFVAGSALGPDIAASTSLTAESGRRAAISAERLFQSVSLTGNRGKEGVFETKLYTNTSHIEPIATALNPEDDNACTHDQAVAEAKRCINCHCLECKRRCVFLQHFDTYSGAAIRPVIKNVNITRQWGHRYANPFIVGCALCGLCGKVCPTDIDMGYVNQNARVAMWEFSYLPPAMHYFPLHDMDHSLGSARLVRHQPGHTKSKYALFPGCQLPASLPDTTKALYKLLTERLEGGVGMLMACCGVPARWAARIEQSAELRKSLVEDWKSLGQPEVLLCCPGCYKEFKEYIPEITVRYIADVLPDILPENLSSGESFAFHDPCMSRGYPELQNSSRSLAGCLGATIEELPVNRDHTVCCSHGGLQYHVNPELSAKTWGDRISQSPKPYLTSCSNCRDFFRFGGKESVHLLELIFGREEDKGSSSFACMDFTKRRNRRHLLVDGMKRELWNETPEEETAGLDIVFPEEMYAKMHKNDMLEQDVRSVITEAETTGRKMISGETGNTVAGRREDLITFWVEYTKEDGRIIVKNCYTHRMKILAETAKDK